MSRIFHGSLSWPPGPIGKSFVFIYFCSCYFYFSSAAAQCGKRGGGVYKEYGDGPVLGHGHQRAFVRLSKYEADTLPDAARFEVSRNLVTLSDANYKASISLCLLFFPAGFPPSTLPYFRHKHKRISCSFLSKYSNVLSHRHRENMD